MVKQTLENITNKIPARLLYCILPTTAPRKNTRTDLRQVPNSDLDDKYDCDFMHQEWGLADTRIAKDCRYWKAWSGILLTMNDDIHARGILQMRLGIQRELKWETVYSGLQHLWKQTVTYTYAAESLKENPFLKLSWCFNIGNCVWINVSSSLLPKMPEIDRNCRNFALLAGRTDRRKWTIWHVTQSTI